MKLTFNSKYFYKAIEDVPNYNRFYKVDEIELIAKKFKQIPSIKEIDIGKTAENQPLKMYSLGTGKKTALIIGVPHSDEPLGSLVSLHLIDWMTSHSEADYFNWKWLIIPILEKRGMRMNEGWFNSYDSIVKTAKSYFREPTENQYEWTFPFEYKEHKWEHPRPESDAIRVVLKEEKPDLLCNLHHCSFYNTYFYFSRNLPKAYSRLRKLSTLLNLPLSSSNPDVPFGKILRPGFYQMYGVKDYIDYYKRHKPEKLLTMRRGANSDEWYSDMIGGFSFNCEVPIFHSSLKKDNKPSDINLLDLINSGKEKKNNTIQYCINILNLIEPFFAFADPTLLNSVLKFLANAKNSIEFTDLNIPSIETRNATNFELFENDLMIDIDDLFLLGQIWRVLQTIYYSTKKSELSLLLKSINKKILTLAKKIEDKASFVSIPLQRLVKMQLGSILIIADVLSENN